MQEYEVLALIQGAILAPLAALHLAWAFGLEKGLSVAVPSTVDGQPLMRPGPFACVSVAIGLLLAAALTAAEAGFLTLPGPAWIPTVGTWGVALVFLARAVGDFRYVGFFKKVRQTPFARLDSQLFSPLCLMLAGLSAGVALWSP